MNFFKHFSHNIARVIIRKSLNDNFNSKISFFAWDKHMSNKLKKFYFVLLVPLNLNSPLLAAWDEFKL
jgi:hypothetical protein